jgi:C-lobe and N-lobe beta barrels of Tf-binding protein B
MAGGGRFNDEMDTRVGWGPFAIVDRMIFQYDADRQLEYFLIRRGEGKATLAKVGEPGFDVAQHPIDEFRAQSVFSSLPVGEVVVVANPYVQGWNYQTFGVWAASTVNDKTTTVSAYSFGSFHSNVPTTGTARFTGKLGGMYVSPTGEGSIAAARLTVNADFSSRSLNFASTGTFTTRDQATSIPAPHLNLSGTLTYTPQPLIQFSGTLTNAGGTMTGETTGRFYGPNAEELGGVFAVKSPTTIETFVGGYGAKR